MSPLAPPCVNSGVIRNQPSEGGATAPRAVERVGVRRGRWAACSAVAAPSSAPSSARCSSACCSTASCSTTSPATSAGQHRRDHRARGGVRYVRHVAAAKGLNRVGGRNRDDAQSICLDAAAAARNSTRYCSREMFGALHHDRRLRFGSLRVPRWLLRDARPARRDLHSFPGVQEGSLHRAYAIARATNGSSAVFVGNEASAEAAEAAALARCQSYASQKLYADPSSCRVYAVDDTILSTGTKIEPASAGN